MKITGDLSELDGVISGSIVSGSPPIRGSISQISTISGSIMMANIQSVKSYNDLTDKPEINARVIEGSKVGADYNLQDKMQELSVQEIERILYID